MSMKRWMAVTENGDLINESDINWSLISEKVCKLVMYSDGQTITLPENMSYIQGKSACAAFSSGKVEVLSRYIGFRIGNKIVKVRVCENTNNISVEVEDDPNYISDTERSKDSD
jgi:hypothetical protein